MQNRIKKESSRFSKIVFYIMIFVSLSFIMQMVDQSASAEDRQGVTIALILISIYWVWKIINYYKNEKSERLSLEELENVKRLLDEQMNSSDFQSLLNKFILNLGRDRIYGRPAFTYRGYNFDHAHIEDLIKILAERGIFIEHVDLFSKLRKQIEYLEFNRTKERVATTVHSEESADAWRSEQQLLNKLRSMTPDDFEVFITNLFEKLGYKTLWKGGSHDSGVDVIAEKGGVKHYIQCKKFITQQVGVPAVREFYGALADHLGTGKGYFITTNFFTLEAEQFVQNKPIELINGNQLIGLIKKAGELS